MIWSDFTKKNFECNNKFDIINDQFIKNLYKIKNDILKKKINFNYTIEETKISNKKINKLKNSEWVDPDLDVDYLNYDIHIKFDNNDIFIKTTKEKFFKIKKRLYIFLKIIKYINNNNKFTLYLILTNKKKYIDNSIISPKNINSGYTNINTNEIFIWREEEFEKVTFHEIIHLSNKDHRNENIDIPILINGPTSFYEAITDFKAIIFNLIYISIIKKNIKLDLLLKYELFFIYNQAKFINFYLNKNKKKKLFNRIHLHIHILF
jgi:hypothetical protein